MGEVVEKIDMVNMSITNKCNLRCPSCPTGRLNASLARSGEKAVAPAFTSLDKCEKIFEKVHRFFGAQLFYLHIWGEPLLHPQIVEILELLEQYGHSAYISSNLNVRVDWEQLLKQPALNTLVISMSGYEQETYVKGHRGGRVSLVLNNMEKISQHLPDSTARVLINFHRYNDNEADGEKLQQLCNEYGIEFGPYPAVALQENIEDNVAEQVFEAWQNIPDIAELVIPRLNMRPFPFTAIKGLENIPCHSQSNILVLDHEGQVCTCTHREPTVVARIGDFLAMEEDELRKSKLTASACQKCRELGLHMSYVFACFFEKFCGTEQQIVDFLRQGGVNHGYAESDIYIFGAGMTGAAVGPLLQHHGYNVWGFIDDDPEKAGKNLHGFPVYSLDDAAPMLGNAIVLDTVRSRPFQRRAKSADIAYKQAFVAEEYIAKIIKG